MALDASPKFIFYWPWFGLSLTHVSSLFSIDLDHGNILPDATALAKSDQGSFLANMISFLSNLTIIQG